MTSRLKIYFFKSQIRYLLRRLGPSTYSMSGEEARKNDYVHIIVSLESDSEGVVIGIENNHLRIQVYADDNPEVLIPISEIYSNVKSISHDYRGWAIRYPSLFQATLRVFLRYPLFNHYWQVVYNQRLRLRYNRFNILKNILVLTNYNRYEKISVNHLATKLYGSRIHQSSDRTPINHLHAVVELFGLSGDLQIEQGHYSPKSINITPKAVETYEKYALKVGENRKKIVLTGLMVLFAAITAWLTWYNGNRTP